jgi:hypothetical protein
MIHSKQRVKSDDAKTKAKRAIIKAANNFQQLQLELYQQSTKKSICFKVFGGRYKSKNVQKYLLLLIQTSLPYSLQKQ